MALDATVGGALSDAYLTVANVDDRAAGDLGEFAGAWLDAVTEAEANGPNRLKKEAAIRRATQDADEAIESVAARWDPDQALLVPRSNDVDDVGNPIIPGAVQQAVYRQALFLFSNAETLDQAMTRRARGMTNFSEPNVSGTMAEDPMHGRYAVGFHALLKPLTNAAVVGWIVRS